MFIEFADMLVNADYILMINFDVAKVDPHPRPFFIKLKFIKSESTEDELFENFETGEECDKRYRKLLKLLTSSRIMPG